MKKYIPFLAICSFILGVVAFVLMMTTNAVVRDSLAYEGTTVLFGKTTNLYVVDVYTHGAPVALVAWILLIVAMLTSAIASILPLALPKHKSLAGVANALTFAMLLTSGVLVLFTKNSFGSANGADFSSWNLGGGYITASILSFVGAGTSAIPAAFAFLR